MDTPLFFILLFIHVTSFIVGFGAVIVIDMFGSLWILKKVKLSQVNFVAGITQRLIWVGWTGLVLSGIGLILHKGYVDNLTMIKLFFVALLGLNGLFLHFIKKSTEHIGDNDEMPALARFRITLASAISQMGWWGAIIIGFVHRHIAHTINTPSNPIMWIIGILLAIGAIALIGESLLRPKAAKPAISNNQAN